MPIYVTDREPTSAATERLARAALELHRLALAAAEVRYLPSPLTPREKNTKGAADPTAGTALDPRRVRVAQECDSANQVAKAVMDPIETATRYLRAALDQWDGR